MDQTNNQDISEIEELIDTDRDQCPQCSEYLVRHAQPNGSDDFDYIYICPGCGYSES